MLLRHYLQESVTKTEQQAIDQRSGHHLVAQHLAPFLAADSCTIKKKAPALRREGAGA